MIFYLPTWRVTYNNFVNISTHVAGCHYQKSCRAHQAGHLIAGLELAGGGRGVSPHWVSQSSLLFVFLASPRGKENVPGTAGAHVLLTSSSRSQGVRVVSLLSYDWQMLSTSFVFWRMDTCWQTTRIWMTSKSVCVFCRFPVLNVNGGSVPWIKPTLNNAVLCKLRRYVTFCLWNWMDCHLSTSQLNIMLDYGLKKVATPQQTIQVVVQPRKRCWNIITSCSWVACSVDNKVFLKAWLHSVLFRICCHTVSLSLTDGRTAKRQQLWVRPRNLVWTVKLHNDSSSRPIATRFSWRQDTCSLIYNKQFPSQFLASKVHQNALLRIKYIKNFLGRGSAPSPDPTPTGEGETLSPDPTPLGAVASPRSSSPHWFFLNSTTA